MDKTEAAAVSELLYLIHTHEHDLESAQVHRMRLCRKREWTSADEDTDKTLAEHIKHCHTTARFAALKLLENHGVHVCGYGLPNPHRPDGADGPPVDEVTKEDA